MLNSFPVSLAVGTILGFLTGLGVGGGSLLLLWLTLVLDLPQETARTINLMFFLPSAAVSTWLRRKQGSVEKGTAIPAIISGCIAAAAFTLLGRQIDTTLLRKLFALLLIVTGLRELLFRPERK